MKTPLFLIPGRLGATFAGLLATLGVFGALTLTLPDLIGGYLDAPPELSQVLLGVAFTSGPLYYALRGKVQPNPRKSYPLVLSPRFHLISTALATLLAVAVAIVLLSPPIPGWALHARQRTAINLAFLQMLIALVGVLAIAVLNTRQKDSEPGQNSTHTQR